jgi:hypothetical protein
MSKHRHTKKNHIRCRRSRLSDLKKKHIYSKQDDPNILLPAEKPGAYAITSVDLIADDGVAKKNPPHR